MKHLNRVIGITVGILSFALLTTSAAMAKVGAEPRTSARPDRIVGVWDVQVSVANCLGGPTFATFPALHKYELGGTGQVVPASNPALLSAHMMAWAHLGGDDYISRFKMFRYDATGHTVGWTIVTNEVSIDKHATSYTGTGIAESFDNDGNFLMASCPSFTGTRFSAEP